MRTRLNVQPMSSIHHGLFALLLIALAALQLNDPDPALWVAIYGAQAALPIARLAGRHLPILYGIAAGLTVAGLLASLPGFIDYLRSGNYGDIGGAMSDAVPYIEPAREFLGTLIGSTSLLLYKHWHIGGR